MGGPVTRRLYVRSMYASMMRRTSSAMEMPRRLASRFKNARCGSVNEIICLVMRSPDTIKLCLVTDSDQPFKLAGRALNMQMWNTPPCGVLAVNKLAHGTAKAEARARLGVPMLYDRSAARRTVGGSRIGNVHHSSMIPRGIHRKTWSPLPRHWIKGESSPSYELNTGRLQRQHRYVLY